jgi:serine/threonine-protein kinase
MAGGGENGHARGGDERGGLETPGKRADAGSLPFGTILGKYRIVDLIGRGGMGIVYRAEHIDLGMLRALKTLAPEWVDHPLAQTRFLKEARAAARISHPHVVKIFDSGSHDGLPFFVMEYLEGEDLASALARSRLTVEQTAGIMLAICAAISEMHEQGLIHRDLKPGNIFLARDKLGNIVPTVLDFGIVKPIGLGSAFSAGQTQDGILVGTTDYISPEQLLDVPAGERSDQYALGVILYQCVTGRRPFEGQSAIEVLGKVARYRFPRPRELCSELTPEFEQVILTAMSERPEDRFPSVYFVGKALFPFASARHRSLWADYYDRPRSQKESLTAPIVVADSSGSIPRPEHALRTQPLSYGDRQSPMPANPLTAPMPRDPEGPPPPASPAAGTPRPAARAQVDESQALVGGTRLLPMPRDFGSTPQSGAVRTTRPTDRPDLDTEHASDIPQSRSRRGAFLFVAVSLVVVAGAVGLAAPWGRAKPRTRKAPIEEATVVEPLPNHETTERPPPPPTGPAPTSATTTEPAVTAVHRIKPEMARPPRQKHARTRSASRSPSTTGHRPAPEPSTRESHSTYPAVGRSSDSEYPAVE